MNAEVVAAILAAVVALFQTWVAYKLRQLGQAVEVVQLEPIERAEYLADELAGVAHRRRRRAADATRSGDRPSET